MTHPVFDEIVRARLPIKPEVFRRWQQEIRKLQHHPDLAVNGTSAVTKKAKPQEPTT